MAKPKLSAANAARKAAKANPPPPLDPASTGTPNPKPKPRTPIPNNQTSARMRADLVQLMLEADPNADVSAVASMDISTLGAALDQARNPDPISTDADLGDLPPDPIVVPKKGKKPKAAAAESTTPAPLPKAKKKKNQPRDQAKQTYTKPTGSLPEAPAAKKKVATPDDPPPPVDQKPDTYFAKYDPAGMLTRLMGKGLYYSPTGMTLAGVGAYYALDQLAKMGRAPPPPPPANRPPAPPLPPDIGEMPPAAPPPAPPGSPPPPMGMPTDQMPPPGGAPPVPFLLDEEEEEQDPKQYPMGDYRRYLKPKPPR